MSGGVQIPVRVAAVDTVASNIKRFRLEAVSGEQMPLFSGGSHVVVTTRDGDTVYRNPYSLMGSPTDGRSYHISVLRTENSRGGSRFLHEGVQVGATMTISHPINLFPIDQRGRKHILIAGGIGITPFIAMAEQLSAERRNFELHYGVRDDNRAAYAQELRARYGRRVHVYRDNAGEMLPLDDILDHQPLGTHLYVCGPLGMIPMGGAAFTVSLARSGKTITVGDHESILEAAEAAGVDAPYLCRGGACGQCETAVVLADGRLDHFDHYLTEEERAAESKIMICVSRFKGRELVLDL